MATQYRLKKKKLVVLGVLVLIVLGIVYLFSSGKWVYPFNLAVRYFNLDQAYSGQKYVLLLGTDARQGEDIMRTDTMMLARLDTEQNSLALLSIPRDTRAEIPGHGYDKINCSIAYGGPETSMKTVSKLLGVTVDNYVLMDFAGFENLIDVLGGVTLTVPEAMYHFDGDYTIDLPAGTYQMTGNQALQFVRYRTYVMGDIERTANQREFIQALYDQLMQSGNMVKLPSLISEINNCLETDLSWSELVSLSYTAINLENPQITSAILEGDFAEIDGISYWQVDEKQAKIQAAEFFGEELKQHENVYFD